MYQKTIVLLLSCKSFFAFWNPTILFPDNNFSVVDPLNGQFIVFRSMHNDSLQWKLFDEVPSSVIFQSLLTISSFKMKRRGHCILRWVGAKCLQPYIGLSVEAQGFDIFDKLLFIKNTTFLKPERRLKRNCCCKRRNQNRSGTF